MEPSPLPSEDQLRRELKDLCAIGYRVGGSEALARVPGLLSLTIAGGPAQPTGVMEFRARLDSLRGVLQLIIDEDLPSEFDDSRYQRAATKLFRLDLKRPVPRGTAGDTLGEIRKGMNEVFGWSQAERGRSFESRIEPHLLEAIARSLLSRERRARTAADAKSSGDTQRTRSKSKPGPKTTSRAAASRRPSTKQGSRPASVPKRDTKSKPSDDQAKARGGRAVARPEADAPVGPHPKASASATGGSSGADDPSYESRLDAPGGPLGRADRWLTVVASVVVAAVVGAGLFLALRDGSTRRQASSNAAPLESLADGSPHGTGISHSAYPDGYMLDGHSRPSFDNYIDYSNRKPNDERPFLGARIYSPRSAPSDGSFTTRGTLHVRPGDELLVSAFIDNDGASAPSGIARDTRIAFRLPQDRIARSFELGALIYARNAVPYDARRGLRTISHSLLLFSSEPVHLVLIPGSARVVQSLQPRHPQSTGFRSWRLDSRQTGWLFDAHWTDRSGNSELSPRAGLPIGNDRSLQRDAALGVVQQQRLPYYPGNTFGYVQFRLLVDSPGTGNHGA